MYICKTELSSVLNTGYTGFVPRARGKLGMGYPLITHMALNEFTDDSKRHKEIELVPFQIHRDGIVQGASAKIYPVESGLVPHYTGHIPGERTITCHISLIKCKHLHICARHGQIGIGIYNLHLL